MSALLKLRSFAFLCCVVLVLCSSFALAQDDPIENSLPCHWAHWGIYYNFTEIQGTQISGSDPAQQWHYYLNLCGVAPACRRDGAMACQQSAFNPQDLYDVAFPNDDVNVHYWSLIEGGVQLTAFGSGLFCSTQGNQRRGVINLYCDTSVTGPVTAFSAPVVEGPPCTYTMTINHTSACGGPQINTTTPAPTTLPLPDTSTDQTAITGAGLGVGISIGIVSSVAIILIYIYVARRGSSGKWNQMDEVNLGKMGSSTTTGNEPTNM